MKCRKIKGNTGEYIRIEGNIGEYRIIKETNGGIVCKTRNLSKQSLTLNITFC